MSNIKTKCFVIWYLSFVIILSFVFCHSSFVYAAPCYGTNMPNSGKWNVGAQTHIITNRELKNSYGKVSSRQYFYMMSYGVFRWLSLDGKIGVGDVTHKAPDTAKTTYPTGFAGGYGFRAKIYENDAQKIGAVMGFQHISVHPDGKSVNNVTNLVILDDWQGSALVSKDFGFFTPYIGARLTRLDLIHKIKDNSRKRKSSEVNIGAVVGADLKINEAFFINTEGRFIEETSFNIGFTYNF
jgi:hypothetical protein